MLGEICLALSVGLCQSLHHLSRRSRLSVFPRELWSRGRFVSGDEAGRVGLELELGSGRNGALREKTVIRVLGGTEQVEVTKCINMWR